MARPAETFPPPQVSFTNWLLGGDLLSTPTRGRRPGKRLSRSQPDPGLVDRTNASTGTKTTGWKHHHRKSRSKDKGTDTEKDAEWEKKKKDKEIQDGRKAVPKDEIAKKEDSKNQSQNSSGWTKAQDDKILSMKNAGNSWKMIAHDVGAAKKDVVTRFKELCDHASKPDGDDNTFGLGEMPGMFNDDEALPTTPPSQSQVGDEKKGGKKSRLEKKGKEEVVVDVTAGEPDGTDKRALKPDAVWTLGDLEVLATVEQRYRELKWMYVQAGFYNLTGRMVGDEVIRAKFEER